MNDLFEKLVKEVLEYESDTFSAEASKITREEAEAVVVAILSGLWEVRIDGVLIEGNLEAVREAKQ